MLRVLCELGLRIHECEGQYTGNARGEEERSGDCFLLRYPLFGASVPLLASCSLQKKTHLKSQGEYKGDKNFSSLQGSGDIDGVGPGYPGVRGPPGEPVSTINPS